MKLSSGAPGFNETLNQKVSFCLKSFRTNSTSCVNQPNKLSKQCHRAVYSVSQSMDLCTLYTFTLTILQWCYASVHSCTALE